MGHKDSAQIDSPDQMHSVELNLDFAQIHGPTKHSEIRRTCIVLNQVRGSLDGLGAEQVGGLVIAYEPVWAIGTGEVATGDDAQEVCGAIRLDIEQRLGASCAQSVRILYGGSVKAANVAGIMSQPDVDGCLVGGASLDADEFIGIVRYRLHPEMLA